MGMEIIEEKSSSEDKQIVVDSKQNVAVDNTKDVVPAKEPVAEKHEDEYIGSEKVNPEKRPLKKFKRAGMSKEEIDKLIEVAGNEIFLDKKKQEEKKDDKADDKTVVDKKEEKKDSDKDEKPVDNEGDIKKFFDDTGISKDDYVKLPEKVQEYIADNYLKSGSEKSVLDNEKKEMSEKYMSLKKDLDAITEDPVIAARLKEIESGEQFVAKEFQPISDNELSEIDTALAENDPAKAKELLNKFIEARAKDAVKKERSVLDKRISRRKAESDAVDIFKEIGKIDKRLSANIKTSDWSEINDKHDDYKEFEKGPKQLVDFCYKNEITLMQIKKMGAEKLYKLFAADKGWDKERDKNIANNSVADFIKRIKSTQPTVVESDHGRQAGSPMSVNTQMGFNRDLLRNEIASGNLESYNRLLKTNEGNPEMIAILGQVQHEAMRLARDNKRKV